MNHRFLVFVVYQSSWKTLSGGGQQVQGRRVFSLSGAAADNYHEDHIAARHAAGHSQGSVTSHVVSGALSRELPRVWQWKCLLLYLIVELSVVVAYEGWQMSPGL